MGENVPCLILLFFCAKRKSAKVIRVKNYWKLSTNCYYLYTELKFLKGQLFKWCFLFFLGGSVWYFFPSQGIERDLIKSQTKRWTQILQIKIQNYFLLIENCFLQREKVTEMFSFVLKSRFRFCLFQFEWERVLTV